MKMGFPVASMPSWVTAHTVLLAGCRVLCSPWAHVCMQGRIPGCMLHLCMPKAPTHFLSMYPYCQSIPACACEVAWQGSFGMQPMWHGCVYPHHPQMLLTP